MCGCDCVILDHFQSQICAACDGTQLFLSLTLGLYKYCRTMLAIKGQPCQPTVHKTLNVLFGSLFSLSVEGFFFLDLDLLAEALILDLV